MGNETSSTANGTLQSLQSRLETKVGQLNDALKPIGRHSSSNDSPDKKNNGWTAHSGTGLERGPSGSTSKQPLSLAEIDGTHDSWKKRGHRR